MQMFDLWWTINFIKKYRFWKINIGCAKIEIKIIVVLKLQVYEDIYGNKLVYISRIENSFLCNMAYQLPRLFNPEAIFAEEQQWYYLTHSWEDKGFHIFPKGICQNLSFYLITLKPQSSTVAPPPTKKKM